MSWIRVSKQNPCPICEKTDWCSVAEDGSVACCQRVPSDWICKGNSGGFLHKLNPDLIKRVKNVFRRVPKKKRLPPAYWHELVVESLDCAGLEPRSAVLGMQLGLSMNSLSRLMVGWLPTYSAWTFPMWDGTGRMIGIRLRSLSGQKYCVSGSFNGIFWPCEVGRTMDSDLFICEGPTDCAALLDLGFEAIGRPNALGGCQQLTDFVRGGRRRVIIVADNDGERGVGLDGAHKLATAIKPLTSAVRVLRTPGGYKDIRGWYNGGGTREELMEMI